MSSCVAPPRGPRAHYVERFRLLWDSAASRVRVTITGRLNRDVGSTLMLCLRLRRWWSVGRFCSDKALDGQRRLARVQHRCASELVQADVFANLDRQTHIHVLMYAHA